MKVTEIVDHQIDKIIELCTILKDDKSDCIQLSLLVKILSESVHKELKHIAEVNSMLQLGIVSRCSNDNLSSLEY